MLYTLQFSGTYSDILHIAEHTYTPCVYRVKKLCERNSPAIMSDIQYFLVSSTLIIHLDRGSHNKYTCVQALILRERELGCCRVVVVAQWSERRQLRSEALGSIPSGCPGIFSLSLFLC